jgi:hypothetical protein
LVNSCELPAVTHSSLHPILHRVAISAEVCKWESMTWASGPGGCCLSTPTRPDATPGAFDEVPTVQGTEQIAEAGKADDELVPKTRLQKIAREYDGWVSPGVKLRPVLHHLGSIVLESV